MTGCYVKAMVPIFCKKKPLDAHHEMHIEGQKRRAAHTTWNAWRTPLGAFYTANQYGQIKTDKSCHTNQSHESTARIRPGQPTVRQWLPLWPGLSAWRIPGRGHRRLHPPQYDGRPLGPGALRVVPASANPPA